MKGVRAAFLLGMALAVAGGKGVCAQSFDERAIGEPVKGEPVPDTGGVGGVLHRLASRAGVVFVGQVESIQASGGVMEVVFSVQKPVIGEVGETYTLREWSGRWVGGQQHYRVGQRAMIFLYAPNAAGISSPVDGMAGVLPLIPMGMDADPLLDVRWLATKVERQVGEPIADADSGAIALNDALAIVTGSPQEKPEEPIRHPLPVGLRPHPVKVWNTEEAQSPMPSILQQQGASDVEH